VVAYTVDVEPKAKETGGTTSEMTSMKLTNTKDLISFLKDELGLTFYPAVRTSWNYEKTETYTTKVLRARFENKGTIYRLELYWALGSVDHIWFIWINPDHDKPIHFYDRENKCYTTHHTVINGRLHKSQLDQLVHYAKLSLSQIGQD
jgi:hypothetical protein